MPKQPSENPPTSDQRYRTIFNYAPFGIAYMDRDGVIVDCNSSFLAIAGATRGELVGFRLAASSWGKQMRSAVLSALSGQPGFYQGEYLSVSGKKRGRVRVFCSPVESGNGGISGAIGFFEDISELEIEKGDAQRSNCLDLRADVAARRWDGAEKLLKKGTRARRKVDIAARSAEFFPSAMMQSTGEGICVCRRRRGFPNIEFSLWNERMVDITGYTLETINRLGWHQCFSRDVQLSGVVSDPVSRALKGESPVAEELEIFRADGSIRQVRITVTVMTDCRPKRVLAVLCDVTEQKLAERELRGYRQKLEILVSEQTTELRKTNHLLQLEMSERKRVNKALEKTNRKLQDIIDFLPDATFVIDRDRRVILWNRAIEEITGVRKEEILGKGDYAYAVPFYGAKRPLLIDMAMDKGIEHEGRYRFVERKKDTILAETFVPELNQGEGAYVWGTASLLFDKDRNVIGAIESIRDISDRRKAEHELRISEERFRAIFESARECIYLKDRSYAYSLANPAMGRILGIPSLELIGKRAKHLFGEVAGKRAEDHDSRVFAGEIIEKDVTRLVQGEPRTFHVIKVPVRDETGEIAGLCGIARDITERKEMERKLEEALKFLQTLMDTIPAPVFYKDAQGLYLGCNRAFEVSLGVSREGIVGKSVFDIAPVDLAEKYEEMDAALMTDSGVQIYESSMLFADGVRHNIVFSKSTFSDATGAPAGIVGVMLDISERKRAEERFRRMVDLSPSPISIIESSGDYIYLNERFIQLFGYEIGEIPNGREWFKRAFTSPEQRRLAVSWWKSDLEAIRNGAVRSRVFSVRCKDGTLREVLFRPAVMDDGLQFITYEDLTELKRAEDDLRESEKRFRLMAESIQDVFWMGTTDFENILYINPTFEKIWGISRQSLYEHPGSFLERIHPCDRERIRTAIGKFAGEAADFDVEYRITRPEGSIRWVRNRAFHLRDEKGNLHLATGVARDITERKSDEEALRRSESELRFLSSRLLTAQEEERKRLARELHDSLGSSLTAVKISLEGALNRLLAGQMDPAPLQRGVALSRLAIEEVRRIIMDLRPSLLDDLGLIATINWFNRQFQGINPHLRVETDVKVNEEDIPESLKTVIFRVMQEAFHNIVKHSRARMVRLSLIGGLGELCLALEDDGQGFDVESALCREAGAKGLGLTSMKERTEFSGGTFSIQSTVGKGTFVRAEWRIEAGPDGHKP